MVAFGPICTILALFALWRQMGVPTYFFRSFNRVYDFTSHITKMKEIGPKHSKLCPFESTPGHPNGSM